MLNVIYIRIKCDRRIYGSLASKCSSSHHSRTHATLRFFHKLYRSLIEVSSVSVLDLKSNQIWHHPFNHLSYRLCSNAVIFLSFWAEVHYNSIYPLGGKLLTQSMKPIQSQKRNLFLILIAICFLHTELPEVENKKKKRWWW